MFNQLLIIDYINKSIINSLQSIEQYEPLKFIMLVFYKKCGEEKRLTRRK